MAALESIPELVARAQANARISQERILNIRQKTDGSSAQAEEVSAATGALEKAAVDIFSVFEARMQHHFKRGPFSRKLKALLVESGQGDLADRLHHYYLAINVLKHGKGASYRELLGAPSALVVMKPAAETTQGDAPASLIDVSADGFFDGLTATILDAYHFLEKR